MTLAKKQATWLFIMASAIIYSAVYFVTRTPRAISHTAVMSGAAMFDLIITVPAAFYLFLIRSRYASWFTLIPVALVGLRSAGFLLPAVDQPYLSFSKWMGLPLEVLLILVIVRRLRKTSGDTLARIRGAAATIIPHERLSHIVAAEIAVIYYALFSWRCKPEANEGSQAFSCAEASGYGQFATLLMLAILFEGVPMHFVLMRFNAVVAWVFAGLDLYCVLWATAIIRAVRLRRIMVDEQWVKIRVGIIWEVEIPRRDIASCRRMPPGATLWKTPGYLKAVVLNDPQYMIELSRPAVAMGLYGNRRVFTQIGIGVDQAQEFAAALHCE